MYYPGISACPGINHPSCDNSGSAIMFVHPDGNGNECKSAMFGYTTPVDAANLPIYDEPVLNRSNDDF